MVKIPAKQQRVNELQTMKRSLGQLVASCSGSDPIDNCPMFQCFGTSTTEGGSQMKTKRQIEIFRAGCQVGEDTVTLVNQLAWPSCEVTILDMKNTGVSSLAKLLGIRTIPAVVVDGHLAERCAERGPVERVLRAAKIGTPLEYGTRG
jgi:hypothetical protein